MDKLRAVKASACTLGLTHTNLKLEDLLHSAEENASSYLDFIRHILNEEIQYRQDKARERRIKEAGFPYPRHLKDFDLDFCKAVTRKQFKQLAELTWIDGIYNLILSGPPGVGKTHLAIGLGYQACEYGYKVSYTTMQSLIKTLRTEEIDRYSRAKMRRIRTANLLIIDEVGYLPISAVEGNLLFQVISELQERTSIILTTNKGFEEWTEFLGDAALATAILDRLTYRCDKISMNGKSYRLENRKSFLAEKNKE